MLTVKGDVRLSSKNVFVGSVPIKNESDEPKVYRPAATRTRL